MKFATISLSVFLLATTSTAVLAENHQHNMQSGMHAAAQGHVGQGVANKIDPQHKKINLTHGPIKSLGWPGMTMDFSVKDAAVLQGIEAGQQVTFEVVNEGPKKYLVTRITPQK